MGILKINAEEARLMTKNAMPEELERARALEDSYAIIRGDAKRGQKCSLQQVFGERQKYVTYIKSILESDGFVVAIHKEKDTALILSISWM